MNTTSCRILVIRAGRLGDTLWATAAIEPLRAHFGKGVEIDLVVMANMAPLFADDPRIHRVFGLRRRGLPSFWSPTKRAILAAARQQPYRLVLDLETGTDFRELLQRLPAQQKVSARPRPAGARQHVVEDVRELLREVVPEDLLTLAQPSLLVADRKRPAPLHHPGGYVLLHPGNSHIARGKANLRAWPLRHWQQLAESLAARHPQLRLVLIGEKAERSYLSPLTRALPHLVDLCGTTSLPELVSVIRHARLVISTDTGPSHLAAVLGTPLITLFGPSDPGMTGPWDSGLGQIEVLRRALPCSPCVHRSDYGACSHRRCMEELQPAQVLDQALDILASRWAESA